MIIIDESIVDKLLEFGYPKEVITTHLNNNDLNNATTAYWLIQMAEKMRQQMAEQLEKTSMKQEHPSLSDNGDLTPRGKSETKSSVAGAPPKVKSTVTATKK